MCDDAHLEIFSQEVFLNKLALALEDLKFCVNNELPEYFVIDSDIKVVSHLTSLPGELGVDGIYFFVKWITYL